MISIKTKEEIALIQKSGKIASFVLKEILKNIKPGVTTSELDRVASRIIRSRGAEPAFLNYQNYPASTCISINDELVHGLPSQKKIKTGDLVKVDVGVNYQGFFSDTAASFFVGRPSKDALRLITGVNTALHEAIKVVAPGVRVGLVEQKTGEILKKFGLSPVMSLSGHGVGYAIHEEPAIRSDGNERDGEILKTGMVLAIEPMATLGRAEVKTAPDKWTVMTKDGSLAAHFEHTIVVTETSAKILT